CLCRSYLCVSLSVFISDFTATSGPNTLSLHDALPISRNVGLEAEFQDVLPPLELGIGPAELAGIFATVLQRDHTPPTVAALEHRSEEHTSELQSRFDLVCRLLLEKKKN